ncbi:hypothetical protein ABK040_011072 [Willaertia magna]
MSQQLSNNFPKYFPEQFLNFCNEQINSFSTNDGWKVEADKDNVKVFSKPITSTANNQNKTNNCYRISTIIQATLDEAFQSMRHAELKLQSKSKSIETVVTLEDHYTTVENNQAPSFDILFQRSTSPSTLIVLKREFLTARYFIENFNNPNVKICIERSIGEDLLEKETCKKISHEEGAVRAVIHFQIAFFEKISETQTKFELMNSIDMGGWIPASLISMALKSAPQKVKEEYENSVKLYRDSLKQ